MTSPTSTSRSSIWAGIVLGVVFLGLLAAFAIGLPKATGDDSRGDADVSSTEPIALPDTLPGGYTATDLTDAFTGANAENAEAITQQQQAMREFGDTTLADVLDAPAVTRNYADEGVAHVVYVQAFRAVGGAFAPDTYVDPESPAAAAQGSQKLVGVDGAVCIESRAPSQAGAPVDPAALPTYTQCQLSEDGSTVQVSGRSLAAADISAVAHDVLQAVAPQDQ